MAFHRPTHYRQAGVDFKKPKMADRLLRKVTAGPYAISIKEACRKVLQEDMK